MSVYQSESHIQSPSFEPGAVENQKPELNEGPNVMCFNLDQVQGLLVCLFITE